MPTDTLSTTFAALADPTRRAILARLMAGEATVSELAEPFEISLPGISKHLKVLEHAGLVERSRAAQWRPCRLDAKPLAEATQWLEGYRRFWEDSFQRLDVLLEEMKAQEKERSTPRRVVLIDPSGPYYRSTQCLWWVDANNARRHFRPSNSPILPGSWKR